MYSLMNWCTHERTPRRLVVPSTTTAKQNASPPSDPICQSTIKKRRDGYALFKSILGGDITGSLSAVAMTMCSVCECVLHWVLIN